MNSTDRKPYFKRRWREKQIKKTGFNMHQSSKMNNHDLKLEAFARKLKNCTVFYITN